MNACPEAIKYLDSGYFTMCNAYPGSGCKKGGSCCPGKCSGQNSVFQNFKGNQGSQ